MSSVKIDTEKLFSYGTLQYESVQLSTFGRKLNGKNDILKRFLLSKIAIKDPNVIATSGDAYHPILKFTGDEKDVVSGMVFEISHQELLNADEYEVDDYKRIYVELMSGLSAWVYVDKNYPNNLEA